MLQEQNLVQFFFRWLTVIILLFIIMNIPFMIERIWSQRYRGYIAMLGEALHSPRRVLALSLGQLIGLLLTTLFLFSKDTSTDSVLMLFLLIVLSLISAILGWSLYKSESR